uniref:Adaptor related protein complex 3 subunit sigma 2 n=1 Tax=Astyanax mexicanus TaxID=7994 RepID=A0A8B9KIR7_ASTMX
SVVSVYKTATACLWTFWTVYSLPLQRGYTLYCNQYTHICHCNPPKSIYDCVCVCVCVCVLQVHYILQEVVMGGMVLETNMNEIVAQVELQNRMEKSEGGLSAAPARAVSAVKNMNLPEIPRNINIGDINIKVPSLSPF